MVWYGAVRKGWGGEDRGGRQCLNRHRRRSIHRQITTTHTHTHRQTRTLRHAHTDTYAHTHSVGSALTCEESLCVVATDRIGFLVC